MIGLTLLCATVAVWLWIGPADPVRRRLAPSNGGRRRWWQSWLRRGVVALAGLLVIVVAAAIAGPAAAAVALAAGAPLDAVERGLAAFEPVAGRSRTLALTWRGRAATLVDDSYNANPDSVRAAIDLLADLPGPRWLLLGDMGEVGAQGAQYHAEVGAHARARGIETVWAAGTLSAQCGAERHFADAASLAAALRDGPAAASLLVKGSRFMRMEQVVAALQALQGTAPKEGPHAA